MWWVRPGSRFVLTLIQTRKEPLIIHSPQRPFTRSIRERAPADTNSEGAGKQRVKARSAVGGGGFMLEKDVNLVGFSSHREDAIRPNL